MADRCDRSDDPVPPDRSAALDRPDGMRETVIELVLEALQRQGHRSACRDSLVADPDHRAAALGLLADCRPLPVIRQLMADVEAGRLSPSGDQGGQDRR